MGGRYVAYYRVSRKVQGESGLGLEAQRRAVATYLKGGDGELVGEFEEVESGKRADRPALNAAMERCALTGSTLLIAKLDRLSRNLHFLTGLQERKIPFICCDQPNANEFTVHIYAAAAQQEAKAISDRTKAALASVRARLDAGEPYVSRRSGRIVTRLGSPKGLTISRPDLGTAALIKRADAFAGKVSPLVQQLAGEGLSLAAIAARLNGMHVQTARGSAWSPMTVKRVRDRAIGQRQVAI